MKQNKIKFQGEKQMKQLIILRGAPGSGKSTFIQEKTLTPYTVSPDELRSLYGSPVLTEVNGFQVNHKNEKRVWNMLSQLIEYRMKEGDFIVVDATHTRAKDFKIYKDLADKYRYRDVHLSVSLHSILQKFLRGHSR